jgi:hypothetical protein
VDLDFAKHPYVRPEQSKNTMVTAFLAVYKYVRILKSLEIIKQKKNT